MAIDSTLFGADIPAGSYTAGDIIQLACVSGPEVVRSGRGAALMKRLTVGQIGSVSGSASYWKIHVKNSDWVDPMISASSAINNNTSLDERSGCIQRGNDCPLTPNSSWEVFAECIVSVTTTVDNSIFALIDIDYPAVSSITDPDKLVGIPTSIEYGGKTISLNALGTIESSSWDTVNVDIFKAGYEYALQKVEYTTGAAAAIQGFFALSNAAGMGGLTRIMPVTQSLNGIKNTVEYATKLVKGPMDLKYLMFANSGTPSTDTPAMIMDFVKRKV